MSTIQNLHIPPKGSFPENTPSCPKAFCRKIGDTVRAIFHLIKAVFVSLWSRITSCSSLKKKDLVKLQASYTSRVKKTANLLRQDELDFPIERRNLMPDFEAVPMDKEQGLDAKTEESLSEFETFIVDFSAGIAKEQVNLSLSQIVNGIVSVDNVPLTVHIEGIVQKSIRQLFKQHFKNLLRHVDLQKTYDEILAVALTHINIFLETTDSAQPNLRRFVVHPKAHSSLKDDNNNPKKPGGLLNENSISLNKIFFGDCTNNFPSLLFGENVEVSHESRTITTRSFKEYWKDVCDTLSHQEKTIINVNGPLVKSFIDSHFEANVEKYTTCFLKNLSKKLTEPKQLQSIIESTLLPLIFDLMFETYAEMIFKTFPEEVGPLLYRLIVQKEADARKKICDKVWELGCNRATMLGKTAYKKFDRDQFDAALGETIDQYSIALQGVQNSKNSPLISPEQITEALKKLFEIDNKDEENFIEKSVKIKKRYGKTIYRLIQEIGGFNSTFLSIGSNFFKRMISRVCSSKLTALQVNRHVLLPKIFKAAQEKFKDSARIKALLSPSTSTRYSVQKDEELHKVAALTGDMITLVAGSWDGVVKMVIGKDPTYLKKTIKKVIETLFGEQLCNVNLFLSIQDVALNALTVSRKKIYYSNLAASSIV